MYYWNVVKLAIRLDSLYCRSDVGADRTPRRRPPLPPSPSAVADHPASSPPALHHQLQIPVSGGSPLLLQLFKCESILQPGNNCSVGIQKKRSKVRHRRKGLKGDIVCRYQFCCHQNMMRGTLKGYVKEICPPKPKPAPNLKKVQENHPSAGNAATAVEVDSDSLLPFDGQNPETRSPTTPLPKTGVSLLDSRRRKRNCSGAKKVDEAQISSAAADMEKSVEASSKTRKKSWTSLKEIAESSGKKFTDLTVPFFICVTV
ncbi:uncharacterized protein LOC131019098 [Salvia miltiorrhiza]|uniref:uncharacterized protein LOC131019098 n=1 Tax=Salvia miltiorrhiza TaxID=226208 RepID=UPI0025AC6DBF|nr:uncharacterized protein LOC131019098 [Salvia miltiorrhiza]